MARNTTARETPFGCFRRQSVGWLSRSSTNHVVHEQKLGRAIDYEVQANPAIHTMPIVQGICGRPAQHWLDRRCRAEGWVQSRLHDLRAQACALDQLRQRAEW